MRVSEKHKLNDAEIYCDLLLLIADIEGIDVINVAKTPDISTAIERLTLDVKYKMLDFEATVRERDYLKGLLEGNGEKS